MRPTLIAAATLLAIAAPIAADPLEDEISSYLSDHGFEEIHIERLNGTVRAKATGDGRRVEIVYDAKTGGILRQELTPVTESPAAASGPDDEAEGLEPKPPAAAKDAVRIPAVGGTRPAPAPGRPANG